MEGLFWEYSYRLLQAVDYFYKRAPLMMFDGDVNHASAQRIAKKCENVGSIVSHFEKNPMNLFTV